MKQCNNKNSGFTLIEIIVVIGIVIVLSSIVFVNYRTAGQQFALQRSANKLAQDIRRASEMAMSGKEFNCQSGWRMKGYGINLSAGNDYYLLKARCEDEITPGNYNDRVLGEPIPLEKGVRILSVTTSNIFFYPPQPVIDLEGIDTAEIILYLETDATKTRTIIINKAGLIYIDN